MTLTVILDSTSKHPIFVTILLSPSGKRFESRNRFQAFREIYEMMMQNAYDKIIISPPFPPFPPTHSKSSLGISLTAQELNERCHMLENWLNEVMNSYNFLSAPVQVAILNTFKCEAYIAEINTPPVIQDAKPPKPAELKQSTSLIVEGLKIFGMSNTSQIERENEEKHRKENKQQEDIQRKHEEEINSLPLVKVIVSRGPLDGTHPTFEASIMYQSDQRPIHISKQFKDYRQLAINLEASGEIYVGSLTEVVDKDIDSRLSSVSITGRVIRLESPFPPTYAKSKLGVMLAEGELQQRCALLDAWLRCLLLNTFQLSPRSQQIVFSFLRLDESVASGRLITLCLKNGKVQPPSTIVLGTRKSVITSGNAENAGGSVITTVTTKGQTNSGSLLGDESTVDSNIKNEHKNDGAVDDSIQPKVASTTIASSNSPPHPPAKRGSVMLSLFGHVSDESSVPKDVSSNNTSSNPPAKRGSIVASLFSSTITDDPSTVKEDTVTHTSSTSINAPAKIGGAVVPIVSSNTESHSLPPTPSTVKESSPNINTPSASKVNSAVSVTSAVSAPDAQKNVTKDSSIEERDETWLEIGGKDKASKSKTNKETGKVKEPSSCVPFACLIS